MKKYCLAFCFALCSLAFTAGPGYHVIKTIQLGGEGGWDYLTVDSGTQLLYVSHSNQVVIVDLNTGKVIAGILDTKGVHGIALVPEFNRGFISCGKSNQAVIFDLKTLKIIDQAATGKNPDAIIYEPVNKNVFTFNGASKDATVINAATGKVSGTIPLGGKPEYAVADETGKVYVNIEDTAEVCEIDGRSLLVARRFSIKPGEEPTGISFDQKNRRIFSGCHNKLMTVLDVETGKLIGTVQIGAGVDGNGFDRGFAFSANGEGTLSVVSETSAGKFEVIETVATLKGARTMVVDHNTHNIYMPAAEFGLVPDATKENPRPRPIPLKDSFKILVLGTEK